MGELRQPVVMVSADEYIHLEETRVKKFGSLNRNCRWVVMQLVNTTLSQLGMRYEKQASEQNTKIQKRRTKLQLFMKI